MDQCSNRNQCPCNFVRLPVVLSAGTVIAGLCVPLPLPLPLPCTPALYPLAQTKEWALRTKQRRSTVTTVDSVTHHRSGGDAVELGIDVEASPHAVAGAAPTPSDGGGDTRDAHGDTSSATHAPLHAVASEANLTTAAALHFEHPALRTLLVLLRPMQCSRATTRSSLRLNSTI